MKRLIKKAYDTTVYHATTIENIHSILNDGIIRANNGNGLGSVEENFGYKTDDRFDTYDGYVFCFK